MDCGGTQAAIEGFNIELSHYRVIYAVFTCIYTYIRCLGNLKIWRMCNPTQGSLASI